MDPGTSFSDTDFVALDGEEIIGRVYQIEHGSSADYGPQAGHWFWTMTAERPGPPFTERSGTEARRGDAGRRIVEACEAMLRRTRGWKLASPED